MAILDMNAGKPNQGMRCIRDIVAAFEYAFDIDEFEVRNQHQLPGLDYDVYISSGGPGNPLEGDGVWDTAWYSLVSELWAINQSGGAEKKYVFFICHSFQMACFHFALGSITRRRSTSFGVMPVHHTDAGKQDPLFSDLPDPFYVVDSRDYQLVQPDLNVFEQHGASILALEKIRTHVDYERAIMAVRFSPEMVGTQFHPEADPVGMKIHFGQAEVRQTVIDTFGRAKYDSMMAHIDDPDKIALTHTTILPRFLDHALTALYLQKPVEV
jgi:GMP synthase-like glutamine amidotransferase